MLLTGAGLLSTVNITTNTLSATSITVNGQPTTYGVANPAYAYVYLNTNTSYTNSTFDMVFDTIGTSNGVPYNTSTGLFTLVAGVTYELETNLYVQFEGSAGYVANYQWVDSSNNALSPTQGQAIPVTSAFNDNGTVSQSLIYTPSQNINVKVRWVGVYGGRMLVQGIKTWAKVKQLNPTIAVQATATGTLNNQYVNVTNAADQTVYATGTDIVWDTLSTSSGIAYSTSNGQFTLTAGSTYNIVGMFSFSAYSANGYLLVQLVDATTNAVIGNQQISAAYNTGYNEVNNISLDIVYTPNTNQTVKFRVTGGTSGLNAKHRGGYFSRAAITQINQAFALNALNTMTTTGDVTVGGNLAVTGNIAGTAVKITAPTFQAVTPSWGLNDVASAAWFLLGAWNTSQAGNCLYMRLLSHCGYNGVATQNQVTELMFVTSNDISYITGSSGNYYAAGSSSVNSRLGTGGTSPSYQAPSKFRIIQVSKTQYQIYAYFSSAYMKNSNYSIQITPGDTWTDGGGNGGVTAPTGNYVEITPSTF